MFDVHEHETEMKLFRIYPEIRINYLSKYSVENDKTDIFRIFY